MTTSKKQLSMFSPTPRNWNYVNPLNLGGARSVLVRDLGMRGLPSQSLPANVPLHPPRQDLKNSPTVTLELRHRIGWGD